MGTAAYAAFMASITNKKFTATNMRSSAASWGSPWYLLLPDRIDCQKCRWESFFITCTIVAIPGMLILLKFAPWSVREAAVDH